MTSVVILQLRAFLGKKQHNLQDNVTTSAANAQAAATAILGDVARVTKATASGSVILPDILTGCAEDMHWVFNDTGVTIEVFPFVGGSINGNANTAQALTTQQAGVFIRDSANNDWRAAAIS
jgi:hypothetical protein